MTVKIESFSTIQDIIVVVESGWLKLNEL